MKDLSSSRKLDRSIPTSGKQVADTADNYNVKCKTNKDNYYF